MYKVGTPLRMKNKNDNGYRVWAVEGVYLGALGQESVYSLKTLDIDDSDNGEMLIPCIVLETHPMIEEIFPMKGEWYEWIKESEVCRGEYRRTR